jgi:hypothetical protein
MQNSNVARVGPPATGLRLRDRTPGGALIPVEPDRDQPLVHHIRADMPPGAVHPVRAPDSPREISCPQRGRCGVRLQRKWRVRCHTGRVLGMPSHGITKYLRSRST